MAVKGRHSTTTTPEQTRKSKTKSRNIPGMVRSRSRASGGRRHGRGWVVFYEKEVRDDVPNDRFSEKSERFGDSENRPLFFDRGRVRICHHVHFYVFPVLADTSPIQIRRKNSDRWTEVGVSSRFFFPLIFIYIERTVIYLGRTVFYPLISTYVSEPAPQVGVDVKRRYTIKHRVQYVIMTVNYVVLI